MPALDIPGCCLIDLPTVPGASGELTFMQVREQVPFAIERLFYMRDVPAGESRAGHAHRDLEQLLIALSGSFEISLDDGRRRGLVTLQDPSRALFLPKMIWHEMRSFAPGTVCLVLASLPYDEADYHRDYAEFVGAAQLTLPDRSGPAAALAKDGVLGPAHPAS